MTSNEVLFGVPPEPGVEVTIADAFGVRLVNCSACSWSRLVENDHEAAVDGADHAETVHGMAVRLRLV